VEVLNSMTSYVRANSCYVSRAMEVIKGSKQQKWPSRSFKGIGNGAIRYALCDLLLAFHCNYVSILPRFWGIITYIPKFKELCDSKHIPFGSNISCMHSYSSISTSTRNLKCLASPITQIWLGRNLEKSRYPNQAPFRGGLPP